MNMSEEQLDFFYKNGYVILPSVLSNEEISKLTKDADALINSDVPFFRDQKADSDGFRHLVELDNNFSSLMLKDRAMSAVLQILGAHIHLSSSHLSYIHPRSSAAGWGSAWHTDIYGTEDDLGTELVRLGVKCAFPLTDHEIDDSGMTLILPRSHRSASSLDIPNGQLHPTDVLQPKVKAGDCFIFENRLRHSVGINLSEKTRKCIFMGYTYRWVIPLDELSDVEELRESLDPLAADLIPRGYRVPANGSLEEFCLKNGIALRPSIKD